jgi:hypothetical protein
VPRREAGRGPLQRAAEAPRVVGVGRAAEPVAGRVLPKEIGITAGRATALGWAVLLFGVLAVLTIVSQVGELFGA